VRKLRTADKWEATQKRRQIFDEHIMIYFQEKARLCRGLSLSFDETRDYIIQGIYHKELAMYVLGENYTDEEGLMSDLLDWTRMNAKRLRRLSMKKNKRVVLLQKRARKVAQGLKVMLLVRQESGLRKQLNQK